MGSFTEHRIEGKKSAYSIPIHVSGSIDNNVHFDDNIDRNFKCMADSQKGISAALHTKNNQYQKKLKAQAIESYTDAVSKLALIINQTDEKTVKYLLSKINESLRLFNFNETNFYTALEVFSIRENYLYDQHNNVNNALDHYKEDFFAKKFISEVFKNKGYESIGQTTEETFFEIVKGAYPTIEAFLTEEYISYTKKAKDVISEISLLQFSDKTGIDIKMNLSPDSFENEFELRKNKQNDGEDEDISEFKLYVVLDEKPQYKEKGRYKQNVYGMNCSLEKLFERLVEEEPVVDSLEEFFVKNELSYKNLGSKVTGIHMGENEVTIMGKDLEIITALNELEDYNAKLAQNGKAVQKVKKDSE